MGFFTSLLYYRPGRPPLITGETLSQFIRRLIETDLVEKTRLSLKVKNGRAIDQDRHDTSRLVMLMPGLGQYEDIEWDVTVSAQGGFDGLVNPIANDQSAIYRAYINFGFLPSTSRITRQPSDQNTVGLYPDGLSFLVEPVQSSNLGTECWHVGWLALSFSGHGYLYPWTLRDIVKRAQDSPEIMRLCDICRSTWPVPSRRPSFLEVRRRKKYSLLWPYDDFKKPYDWYWGVRET